MKKVVPIVSIVACSILVGLLAIPLAAPGPGFYGYITRVESNITSIVAAPRGFGSPGYIQPGSYTGNKTLLVILLEFQDVKHGSSRDQAYYENLLFNTGNPESLASFFDENSYGRLQLTGIVTNWITSSQNMDYYGGDSGPFPNIDDANGDVFEMAREAVQLANPTVNFANFDEDGDDYVDNLVVIHAGAGQESSSDADDIWSHRWAIQPKETVDGVYVDDYATLAESSPVGVFAHEYGHLLDLPDFYDYTYSGVVFAGDWAVMDSGSWNGFPAGTRPSHFVSWSKLQMGFINATETRNVNINDQEAIVDIIPTSSQAVPGGMYRVVKVNISPGVYYTIEARNKSIGDFESSLPDQGVIISYCDDSRRDDVFYGNPGAVVVMNAQPGYPGKEHAPFDLGPGENPRFVDDEHNIVIEVTGRNLAGGYTVKVTYVQLAIEMLYIDGSEDWITTSGTPFDLTVTLKNVGGAGISDVSAELDSTFPGVTVTQPTSTYGDFTAGQAKNGSTDFTVSPVGISSTPMNFTLNVTFNTDYHVVIPIDIPNQLETTAPNLVVTSPTVNSSHNAGFSIHVAGDVSDPVETHSGMFKAWVRYTDTVSGNKSSWTSLSLNETDVSGDFSIPDLGVYNVTVKVMDKSGNINVSVIRINIMDMVPPTILLTINDEGGSASVFAMIGAKLRIVTVVIDNVGVDVVNVSINAGDFFSIKMYPANVTVTGGGANNTIYGTYPGYFYDWEPSIEGDNLIVLRATDTSGNVSEETWALQVISTQTIMYIVIVIVVVLVIFSCISSAARRRSRRTVYKYSYN